MRFLRYVLSPAKCQQTYTLDTILCSCTIDAGVNVGSVVMTYGVSVVHSIGEVVVVACVRLDDPRHGVEDALQHHRYRCVDVAAAAVVRRNLHLNVNHRRNYTSLSALEPLNI